MNKFPLKSLQKELSERAIFEKHPSELTENDLTFILGNLHISLVFSFFETDPLENMMAMAGVLTMTDAMHKWASWKASQVIDAAKEALDNGCED